MSLVGKKLGNYQITKLLGAGGMGSVYLAEHPIIGRKVAIKVLHPEMARTPDMVRRFFQEARAANDIGNPHIVEVVDLGETVDEGAQVVYLVMEFLEGESLKQRLRRKPLAPQEIAHVVDQVASALTASHAKHIIHRDLKPDNVYLLEREGDPLFAKVLDFGIAKLLDLPESQGMTRSGTVLGTPEYMSPEQCDGSIQLDHRTDIYALGVMLYEMLTGRLPFSGTLREILLGQMTAIPPAPTSIKPEADPTLSAIAMRCLAKDRGDRYSSMEALRMALVQGGFACGPGLTPVPGTTGVISRPLAAQAPTQISDEVSRVSAEVQRMSAELHRVSEEVQHASHSSLQAESTRRRRWRAAVMGAAVAVALLVGAGLSSALWPRYKKGPAPVPATQTEERIDALISSEPTGAQVLRIGDPRPLGKTPLTLTLVKGQPDFKVELVLEGHETATLLVLGDRTQRLHVALHAVPAPPAATAAAPPPGPPAQGSPTAPGTVAPAAPGAQVAATGPAGTPPKVAPAAPQGATPAAAPAKPPPDATAKKRAAALASAKVRQKAAAKPPAAAPSAPVAPAGSTAMAAAPVKPKNQPSEPVAGEYLHRPRPTVPQEVRRQLRGSEMSFVAVLCANQAGEVTKVRVLQGIPGADDAICRTLMSWRLKPQPGPLCYPVRLLYAFE